MTAKRIFELAYMASLEIWGKELEFLEKDPDNEINRIRETKAHAELQEIRRLLIAEENKK